ncbi:hypothetical protein SAMN05421763_1026 [[Luteovulum] sphaeroides subsp. megalophilum]|nr:hypothetical protein SAMN05421763_1026 [[Luteovulum] sphaeroides subsp. megalophilum]
MDNARSPHARGCPELHPEQQRSFAPFPARAGMSRPTSGCRTCRRSVPRTRGDVPAIADARAIWQARSPHARGCPAANLSTIEVMLPFPARAGMSRTATAPICCARSVPRTRGDVPTDAQAAAAASDRSPHARGCPAGSPPAAPPRSPFPARAGMSRGWAARGAGCCAVPRTRGDVPKPLPPGRSATCRSPHARGCPEPCLSLGLFGPPFPARAGMSRCR